MQTDNALLCPNTNQIKMKKFSTLLAVLISICLTVDAATEETQAKESTYSGESIEIIIPEPDPALPQVSLGENLIINGDFNYYSIEQANTGQFFTIDEWYHIGNEFNGKDYVVPFDEATATSDVIGDLSSYLSERLYEYNSWQNSICLQGIEVEPNAKYHFSYIWQSIVRTVRYCGVTDMKMPVSLWVKVYPCDDLLRYLDNYSDPLYSKEITWEEGQQFFITQWSKANAEIIIPSDVDWVRVEIGVYGMSGDDGQGAYGTNDVQMNVSGISLRKVLSDTPINPDPVGKTNYMEGATSGLPGQFYGEDSQLVKNGWQLWNCPFVYDALEEEFIFGSPENLTAEWPGNVRLENNDNTAFHFLYNGEQYDDNNIATFRWDSGPSMYYWYSYPVDLPEAGTYSFSMKAADMNNYNPNLSASMYVCDGGIMAVITEDLGPEYINRANQIPNYGNVLVNIIPVKGYGAHFPLYVGNNQTAYLEDCETEFTVTKPGRYYISIMGSYAFYACTDFSLTLKGADTPVEPDPVVGDHVNLTMCHGGMDIDLPVAKGKAATVAFNHDQYWEMDALTLNGEDVTNDMVGNRYTTPELHENATLVSSLRYTGDLTVGPSTGVVDLENSTVSVTILDHKVVISGLTEGDEIVIYNISGQILNSHSATTASDTITLGDGVYIIRINNKAVKVMI